MSQEGDSIEMKCTSLPDVKVEQPMENGYNRLNEREEISKHRLTELLNNLKNVSSRIKFYVIWGLVFLVFINAIVIFLHFYSTAKNKTKDETKHVVATHSEVNPIPKALTNVASHFVFAEEDSWRDNDNEELSEDSLDNNAMNRGKRQLRRNLRKLSSI